MVGHNLHVCILLYFANWRRELTDIQIKSKYGQRFE